MSRFAQAANKTIKKSKKHTHTENGQKIRATTKNNLLDLFALSGSLRSRTESQIRVMFDKAFNEDQINAIKTLFYIRDIEYGLGERRTFRILINYLFKILSSKTNLNINKLIPLIPLYGRYDDLYSLFNTSAEKSTVDLIKTILDSDVESMKNNKKVTLLAKWLKSPKTSSKETTRLGRRTAKLLNMSEKEYRKTLSELRHYLDVTERKMSSNEWSYINYSSVPSLSMIRHKDAFIKHDKDRFNEYLAEVNAGKQKINSKVLTPSDIIHEIVKNERMNNLEEISDVLNNQWKSLPNYVNSNNNVLIVADTSGSMSGKPIEISIGLALYFAERNQGAFNRLWASFSEKAKYHKIEGTNIVDMYQSLMKYADDFDMNTNIESLFNLILDTAIKNNISESEMPKSVIIVSDMEFDECTKGKDFFKHLISKFKDNGYRLPNLVFWNADSRQNILICKSDTPGVQLVSGSSSAIFNTLMKSLGMSPKQYMLSVLNSERYKIIDDVLNTKE